ncbi:MAG: hypothetical protein OEZ57_14770 [Nitrospirota bacterium]|nr:hypothetical protein [Nitrospirota bacterium]
MQAIGKLQVKRGNLRTGIRTALQAGEGNPNALRGIVFEQVNSGHLKEVLVEIRRISSYIPRQLGLMNVALALLTNNNLDSAIEVTKQIPAGYASAIAWKEIALTQIEAGNRTASLLSLQHALVGALATQNTIAKSDFLWRIAGAQAKSGDITGALQTASLNEAEFHRHLVLRDIVDEQVKAGDAKGALQAAATIREKFKFTNPYISVLQDLARAGKVDQALKIAASMEAEFEEYSPFEAIAVGQAEAGDIEGALKTWPEVAGKSRDALLEQIRRVERISHIQVQNGDLAGAMRTVSRINKSWRANALKDISLAYVKRGKVDRALEVISTIEKEQPLADLLRQIAYAQAFKGDFEGVLKWSQKIISPYVRSRALLGAVRGVLDIEKAK